MLKTSGCTQFAFSLLLEHSKEYFLQFPNKTGRIKHDFQSSNTIADKLSTCNQYSSDLSMMFVKCSLPSAPATSPMPGARSNTRLCGIVPSTKLGISAFVYPTAFSPRGTPRLSRNRAIASYKCAPMAESGIAEMLGSKGVVFWKIARASRCRDGEDGAVNWKTAGADSATLTPCGMIGWSTL